MKPVHSFLLLAALSEAAVGLFWRRNIYVSIMLPWDKAQTYCRNNYVDLSTADSQDALGSLKADAGQHLVEWCWIGLSQTSEESFFTKWSDGSPFSFSSWGHDQPNSGNPHRCVFIDSYGWFDYECDTNLRFYCYVWEPQLFVVREMKTWEEALVHCRTFYTDLVIVNTEADLFVVSNKSLKMDTSSFWTGLRSLDGTWFWMNKTPLEESVHLPLCSPRPFGCGAQNTEANILQNRDCNEKMNFICYSKTV